MLVYVVKEELRFEGNSSEIIAVESSHEAAVEKIFEMLTRIYACWRYSNFCIEEWEVGGKCNQLWNYGKEANKQLLEERGAAVE